MRHKKIRKSIESLEKQKQIHLDKIENYDGLNDTIVPYWEKEIERIEDKIKELKERLEK